MEIQGGLSNTGGIPIFLRIRAPFCFPKALGAHSQRGGNAQRFALSGIADRGRGFCHLQNTSERKVSFQKQIGEALKSPRHFYLLVGILASSDTFLNVSLSWTPSSRSASFSNPLSPVFQLFLIVFLCSFSTPTNSL